MKFDIKSLSETESELRIELPATDVDKEFRGRFRELNRNVQIPGFRKGKIPASLLRRRFGPVVEAEIAQEFVPKLVVDALEKSGLEPIGEPHFHSVQVKESQPLEIVLHIEHLADFELANYKGRAPAVASIEIGGDQIEKELRKIQLTHAERTGVDRSIELGDEAVGQYRLFVGQEPPIESEDPSETLRLVIGEDELFPSSRLDRKLVGQSSGQPFRIVGEIPLAYPDQSLRGKEVTLEIELNSVNELTPPDLTDDFAQEHFEKTLDELRTEIREALTKREERKDRQKRLDVVFERLRADHTIAVPESLLQEEIEREENELKRSGVPETVAQGRREDQNERAARKVRNGLLLRRIIKQEKIEATESDLKERFAELAPAFGQDPDQVAQLYSSNPQLQQSLKDAIVEQKALDFLLESTAPLILEA